MSVDINGIEYTLRVMALPMIVNGRPHTALVDELDRTITIDGSGTPLDLAENTADAVAEAWKRSMNK